jgi:hypothetical protein
MGAVVMRPARKTEPENGLHLSSIRQRIESIFWTCKDLLTLERHGARTITSPPPSPSTTNSAAPAALSSTTPPKPWNQPSSAGLLWRSGRPCVGAAS